MTATALSRRIEESALLLERAASFTGIPAAQILSHSGFDSRVPAIRYAIWSVLRCDRKWSVLLIAKAFRVSVLTVRAGRRRAHTLAKQDPAFNELLAALRAPLPLRTSH